MLWLLADEFPCGGDGVGGDLVGDDDFAHACGEDKVDAVVFDFFVVGHGGEERVGGWECGGSGEADGA